MRKLPGLLFLLVTLMPVAGYSADDAVPSILRIGTAANYAPLAFMQDGEFQGVEADLAKEITRRMQINNRILVLPWKELISALKDGRIDIIMGGMSITEARSQQIRFTDPYMKVGQMALIRTSELVQWNRPGAFLRDGARIGVIAGTTGEDFVRADMPQVALSDFKDTDSAVQALLDNKIDVFIHDAPTIWRLTATSATMNPELFGIYRPLTEEYLAWAVRTEDEALADALNRELADMHKDGSLNRITRRWIPVTVKVGN